MMDFKKFTDLYAYLKDQNLPDGGGKEFERIIIHFLKTDNTFRYILKDVISWNEWNHRKNVIKTGDIGIDLVAETIHGEFWAIQCKFYEAQNSITLQKISTFIATSNIKFTMNGVEKSFDKRILVTTSYILQPNAKKVLDYQGNANILNRSYLEHANINWNAIYEGKFGDDALGEIRMPREHQTEAINKTQNYFQSKDRGKLIMACGTGKTFTALKIAEQYSFVCFLVPSIALLGQTLREWTNYTSKNILPILVCSDHQVGKADTIERNKTDQKEENKDTSVDLALPATTNPEIIVHRIQKARQQIAENHLIVIFSTYQSIDRVMEAQQLLEKKDGQSSFDLIICDEAHRTAGYHRTDEIGSPFVKVHHQSNIKGDKRLYMTATPKIYEENIKDKDEILSYSMDDRDSNIFGDEIYRLNFGDAIKENLLADYQVLIMQLDRDQMNEQLQSMDYRSELSRQEAQELLDLEKKYERDLALKLMGSIQLFGKIIDDKEQVLLENDIQPMQNAVAFCNLIEHSKKIRSTYNRFQKIGLLNDIGGELNHIEADHVDGKEPSLSRLNKLNWLKDTQENKCKVLTNAKCLTEGVDVPTLDAILFLTKKSSQIDIVQSVGRVMRKADHKKRGYILIPILWNQDKTPESQLKNSEEFGIIWKVLNALRSHDENFDIEINQIRSDRLIEPSENETQKLKKKVFKGLKKIQTDQQLQAYHQKLENQFSLKAVLTNDGIEIQSSETPNDHYPNIDFPIEITHEEIRRPPPNPSRIHIVHPTDNDDLKRKIAGIEPSKLSKILLGKIVEKCGNRAYWSEWTKSVQQVQQKEINNLVYQIDNNYAVHQVFEEFVQSLSILNDDADWETIKKEAIQILADHIILKPIFKHLFPTYDIETNNSISEGLENVLEELQDWGTINYTDEEQKELQGVYEKIENQIKGVQTLGGKQAIIKEFYGGYFKVSDEKRQARDGIIYTPIEIVDFMIQSTDDLLQEYFGKRITNEGVHVLDPFTGTGAYMTRLLESEDLIKKQDIVRKYESELHAIELQLLAYYIADVNIETAYYYRTNQKKQFDSIIWTDTFGITEKGDLDTVHLQENSEKIHRLKSQDIQVIIGNPPYSVEKRQDYPNLRKQIRETYGQLSRSGRMLGNAYVKSFRWATNKLNEGIIAYITPSSWLTKNGGRGIRHHFEKDFHAVYVYDLKGERRPSTHGFNGNGVFEIKSDVAITFLIKKPKDQKKANIYYTAINENTKKKEKLTIIKNTKSVIHLDFEKITPNPYDDWVHQRVAFPEGYVKLNGLRSSKKDNTKVLFQHYSNGFLSGNDARLVNFSKKELKKQISLLIGEDNVDDKKLRICSYRPFTKVWTYWDNKLLFNQASMPTYFPNDEFNNITIGYNNKFKPFSVFVRNTLTYYHMFGDDGNLLPLKYQTNTTKGSLDFGEKDIEVESGFNPYHHHFNQFKSKPRDKDFFAYIYAVLHHKGYRDTHGITLSREIPAIPIVQENLFYEMVTFGDQLIDLHLNYENRPPP